MFQFSRDSACDGSSTLQRFHVWVASPPGLSRLFHGGSVMVSRDCCGDRCNGFYGRVGATVGDRSAMVPAAEGPTEGGTIAGIDATATFFHSATVSRLGGFAALVVATVSWGAGAMVSETVAGTGATVSTRVGATVGDRSAMVPAAEGPTEGGTIAGIDATATFFHSATVSRLGGFAALVVATVSWGTGAMVSETVAGTGATVSTRVGATVGDRSAMVPAAEGPAEGGTIAGIDATATGSFSSTSLDQRPPQKPC